MPHTAYDAPPFYGNIQRHPCCWILANGTACSKPVGYKLLIEDGLQTRIRDYAAFCDEHMLKATAQSLEDV